VPHSAGPERIAVISDVHGNLTALEAVLDHIRDSGISRIFNLGDLVGKGPNSAAVVDRCREVCEAIVQGNWDADVAKGPPDYLPGYWHHQQLGAERNAFLATLPGCVDVVLAGKQLRLFHASEISPFNRVHETAPRERHRSMFSNTEFTGFGSEPQVVGYGDIHVPYVLNFGGKTLFNAGSVGNPLDEPRASYCVVEGDGSVQSWSLRIERLGYDIEGEVARARRMDIPEFEHYARELRTAVYRGRKS